MSQEPHNCKLFNHHRNYEDSYTAFSSEDNRANSRKKLYLPRIEDRNSNMRMLSMLGWSCPIWLLHLYLKLKWRIVTEHCDNASKPLTQYLLKLSIPIHGHFLFCVYLFLCLTRAHFVDVMVQLGVNLTYIMGPFFFEGLVNIHVSQLIIHLSWL